MTKNFAHRGFSGKYPENTMLAFRKAVEEGCDGIELDVHLSKDQELVIIHDEKLDRTTTGHGWVRDYTLEELRTFDASYRFAGQFGINRIPTLREYFELVKDQALVTNIELKTGICEYPGIEKKVYEMIQEFGLEERVIISSFNHFSVRRMKELAPSIKCGLLTESWLYRAGEYTKGAGAECYHPMYLSLTPESIEEIRSQGIEINTWTVNEEADILDMFRKGVESVIGNYPDVVNRVKRQFQR